MFLIPLFPIIGWIDRNGWKGKRSEKVADLIQKEISEMLLRTVKDPSNRLRHDHEGDRCLKIVV